MWFPSILKPHTILAVVLTDAKAHLFCFLHGQIPKATPAKARGKKTWTSRCGRCQSLWIDLSILVFLSFYPSDLHTPPLKDTGNLTRLSKALDSRVVFPTTTYGLGQKHHSTPVQIPHEGFVATTCPASTRKKWFTLVKPRFWQRGKSLCQIC